MNKDIRQQINEKITEIIGECYHYTFSNDHKFDEETAIERITDFALSLQSQEPQKVDWDELCDRYVTAVLREPKTLPIFQWLRQQPEFQATDRKDKQL